MSPQPEPDEPPPNRTPTAPLVLGVLGGIASGKSTVARALAGPDGLVLSADAEAHRVLAEPETRAFLRERFGPEVLTPDGVDRERLAARVFDPERGADDRRALEDWTHPRVRARILAALSVARDRGIPRVVLDVPLLLENDAQHGFVRLCDALVFVEVDATLRDRRAQESRGWKPGEVARREASQLPLESKRQRADFVVHNDGTPAQLEDQVARVLARFSPR